MKNFIKLNLIALLRVLCAAILTAGGYFSVGFGNYLSLGMYLLSFVILCYDVLIGAIKELIKKKSFGGKMLMFLASSGAMIIGEYLEANVILAIFVIMEITEKTVLRYSKKSIEVLSGLQTDRVRLKNGNVIPAKDVTVNEVIEIYPQERIAVDGMVIGGMGTVDTSVITGEKKLHTVKHGSKVFAGYLNKESKLTVMVTRPLHNTIAQRIVDITETSFEKKTRKENFVDKFAKIYTIVAVIIAVLIAIVPPVTDIIVPVFGGHDLKFWVYKAICFLIASCPCAMLFSVPLAYFRGVRYASKKGILIKGSSSMEALYDTEIIAFDKTSTLTRSELVVTSVDTYGDTLDKVKLLKIASIVERDSKHPIANAIRSLAKDLNIEIPDGENYAETVGSGVECDCEYGHVKAGGKNFVDVPVGIIASVYVSLNGEFVGSIGIGDQLKYNSVSVFEKLRKLGIKKKIILTGDKKFKADKIAKTLLAETAYSNLKPADKVHAIEDIRTNNPKMKIAYCGDGIDDISSLDCADVGISMGAMDSDSAVEASDVIIMDDNLDKVAKSFRIAKNTRKVSSFNVVFSIILKIIVIALLLIPCIQFKMTYVVLVNLALLIITVVNSLLAGR